MASNSVINPAPNPSIDTFNPELWDNTEKTVTTTSILPDDTVSLLFADTNTMTAENTFNSTTDFVVGGISNPFFDFRSTTRIYFAPFVGTRTLSAPYPGMVFYSNTATAGTLNIPSASQSLAGISIIFVRYIQSTRTLNSSSANINNLDSLTFTNAILSSISQSTIITCGYNGSGYSWYMTMN